MSTRIYPIALFLAIACGSTESQGQATAIRVLNTQADTVSQRADSPDSPSDKTAEGTAERSSDSRADQATENPQDSSDVRASDNLPDNASDNAKDQPSGGLRAKPSNDVLDAISAPNILTEGTVPESAAAKRGLDRVGLPQHRGWSLSQVCWQSSNICHLPLYFEDAMLERHGHERFPVLQPMVSGTKFISTIALLPYLTALHHPCECRYALGHFRPGTCAPVLKDTLPWDRRAAAAQALGVTGVVVGLPW